MNAGLVLTGGGARAAYQVGVVRALAEILPGETSPFRTICGTSAGAINCVHLAAHAHEWHQSVEELQKLWLSLTPDQVFKTTGISLGGIGMRWVSRTMFGGLKEKKAATRVVNYLLDTDPLRELLQRVVDFDRLATNISSGVLNAAAFTATHYFAGTAVTFFDAVPEVNLWTRSNRLGQRTRINAEHVMASSAIPIFFPPVALADGAYGDGCLRQTTPLSPAIHLGADRILAVGIRHERQNGTTLPTPYESRAVSPSLAQIGGELLNALFLDSLESDVERMQRINGTLFGLPDEIMTKHLAHLRYIPVMALRPSRDLGSLVPDLLSKFPFMLRYLLRGIGATQRDGSDLVSYLAFDPAYVTPLIELGYEDTLAKKAAIVEFMEKPVTPPVL
jgi:NTE family protein